MAKVIGSKEVRALVQTTLLEANAKVDLHAFLIQLKPRADTRVQARIAPGQGAWDVTTG